MSRVLLLLAGALALLRSPAQTPADSVQLAKADTLRAHAKYKEALRIYDGLVQRNTLLVPALIGRAASTSDIEQSMQDVQRVLALEPGNFKALVVRAKRFEHHLMFDRAVADLEVAIPHAPDTTNLKKALNDLAWDRVNMRDFDQAIEVLHRIQAMDSTDTRSMNTLALALEELGQVDEAYRQLQRFIAADTNAMEGYHNLAYFLSKHDRHQEALAVWNKIERRERNDAYFWNNRGYTKLKLGDAKGALKDIQHSLEMDKSNSYAYRNLGLTYQAMGRKDDACDAFEKALAYGFTERFGDEVKKTHDTYCH